MLSKCFMNISIFLRSYFNVYKVPISDAFPSCRKINNKKPKEFYFGMKKKRLNRMCYCNRTINIDILDDFRRLFMIFLWFFKSHVQWNLKIIASLMILILHWILKKFIAAIDPSEIEWMKVDFWYNIEIISGFLLKKNYRFNWPDYNSY